MATSRTQHLENAAVNLVSLREHARLELVAILDSLKGTKCLVLDESVSGPLGLVAEPKLLKEHGIDEIHYLSDKPVDTRCASVLYVCRPEARLMTWVSRTVRENNLRRQGKEFAVFFVPRRTMLCERELATNGVFGDVRLGEFKLDLIPFERDLVSLETPLSFRLPFVDGDPTCMHHVARSLMKLQSMFGLIPRVCGRGVNASRVFGLMRRMRAEMPAEHFAGLVPEISRLVLIDRTVDMVTPLLRQRTYEGLLDEVVGIRNGVVEVPGEERRLALNSSDTVFADVRDLHFRALGPLLHRKASEIKATYSGKDQAKTVSEMAAFMKDFKSAHQEHNFLQQHIALAEKLAETTKTPAYARRLEVEQWIVAGEESGECDRYVEAAIDRRDPLPEVLRLLCLQSQTSGGIKAKRFDALRHAVVQSYGYEHTFTLAKLERLGLLVSQQQQQHMPPGVSLAKGAWSSLRKALRLVRPPEQARGTYAATYDGYAPLAVRLVEAAQEAGGWSKLEDVLALLPGLETLDFKQELPASVEERARIAERDGSRSKKPLTLVYFLGGVTHAEVSAFRYLSELENHGTDYIVATTELVNGRSLMEQCVEALESRLKV